MQLFELQQPNVRDSLRYNILPSDIQRQELRASIATARLRLVEIEAQESNVLPDLDGDVLREYISDYSSLLAPIRLLSVEILQTIFIHPDIHDFERMGPCVVTMYRPKVIGEVSHHWRAVARGTPQLWSSFQVKLTDYKRYPDLEGLRLRLQRSKNIPLSISFNWVPARHLKERRRARHTEAVTETVAELLAHAERWEHVVLPLHPEFLVLCSAAQGRLPQLRTIAFTSHSNPVSRQLQIFTHAPKLRSLCLERASGTDLPSLPWHQLDQVSLSWHDISTLAMTSRLRGIILRGGPDDGEVHPLMSNPWRSTELRKIILIGSQSNSKHHIAMKTLSCIETPELKEMLLIQHWVWDSPSISSFLQCNYCLETLVLQECGGRPAEILALLPLIPSVSTLVFIDNHPNTVTNAVLDALILSSPDVRVLPSLSTLVLRGSYLFSNDKLLTMLESRMGPGSPLVNIDITLPGREVPTPDLDRFAGLPGVESTYLTPVWFIFAGPRRDWRYSDQSEL